MVNGAGYNDHPDCDKYIQCHYNDQNVLEGEIMNCAFGTHWDMGNLTCLPIGQTECNNDQCKNEADGVLKLAHTNCRGYIKCMNKKSEVMCCSYNQTYIHGVGCVEDIDDRCNDTCLGVSESKLYPKQCDFVEVPNNPTMFKLYVAGHGLIDQQCAPGSYFIKEACACIGFTKPIVTKPVCKPEIHLPFTKNHEDESGNRNYVFNDNVEINNGVARFNGVNSRLVIPRFTNLEHNTEVVIKIKYSSKHGNITGLARALISNSDCGNLPSVMVSEDKSNVYFGVGTDRVSFAYTYVPQTPADPSQKVEKIATYRFVGGELIGSNGANTDSVPAPGYLHNVRCAIHIGHAEKLLPFDGDIDEISIYLCDPDKP